MGYTYGGQSTTRETFSFTLAAGPPLKLCFDRPLPIPHPTNRPVKRRRALSDVDGDGNEGRKKRRLRLQLITSRLSRPFSQPASNIVSHGISKIAVWGARNRNSSKTVLRKAAIMNRVRKTIDAAKDFMRLEQERRKSQMLLRQIVIQKPRCNEMPLPPSPLGLSAYDALDLEDDISDPYDEDFGIDRSDGMDRISAIYSDFNIMNPVSSDGNDGDDDWGFLDALDGIQPRDLPDTPPPPPEDSIVDLLREKERQGDGYFVTVRE